MSIWTVGKRDIYFWRTNWLGEIIDHTNPSSLTISQGIQDINLMQNTLTTEQLYRAMAVVLDETRVDEIVFTLTPNGVILASKCFIVATTIVKA